MLRRIAKSVHFPKDNKV
uniref:Uncharacterized protein n=1 Tax=Anguilla anguilla TaxID=7936 RepID=A0A0E9QQ43_ANGAN